MARSGQKSLRAGHRKAIGIDENAADLPDKNQDHKNQDHKNPGHTGLFSENRPLADRYELLRDIPRNTIRKAWFTLAHLLLEDNSKIVDMGCQNGEMVYSMAALAPGFHFVGVDLDKKLIAKAQEKFKLPNLEFICGDMTSPELFKPESFDAIVSSFILHEIYSGSHYNERIVIQMLENQFRFLKPDGIMFIRDFTLPVDSEYVLMEMPDVSSKGPDLKDMSESDLLVWYSENARPGKDPGFTGFFLEELPPRFPKTRLFRLPSKWAYEFILRKDERGEMGAELSKEYTFLTERDYRKTLRSLGSRVLYTAPHWDEEYVKAAFDGHFRLYDENGNLMGTPPTSFIAIAQKIGEQTSLRLNERRTTSSAEMTLHVHPMRNEIDGRIVDVLSRDVSTIEILPWRLTSTGDLNVYVHIGAPRGIVNAIPRHGRDLDGKRWSGHMTEAISVNTEIIGNITEGDVKGTLHFMRDIIGLKPLANKTLEVGPAFYPAPDFIDERIETRFIEVEKPKGPIEPRALPKDLAGFKAKGRIIELSAQSILNAISVGAIPNAQLELQIMALYEKIEQKPEAWIDSPLSLPEIDVPKANVRDLLRDLSRSDDRYKKARAPAGQWRMLQSVFVEEGHQNGTLTGLASRTIDFAISDENSENIAVVLPLVRNLSGEVMAGFVTEYLPVPQRHKGSGMTINAPSVPLPHHITNMDAARLYIADHFKVKPESVHKLGESFFCHIGVTPQRIYPFAITEHIPAGSGPGGRSAYMPMEHLWKLNYWDSSKSFMKVVGLAYKRMAGGSDHSPVTNFSMKMADRNNRPVTAHATDLRGLSHEQPRATEEKSQDRRKPLPK